MRALFKIASALVTHSERVDVLDDSLHDAYEHLIWASQGANIEKDEELQCRDLALISIFMHEVNDNEAATRIIALLRTSMFAIALKRCAIGSISRAICPLFEVCLKHTLVEDGGTSCKAGKTILLCSVEIDRNKL